jgi:hypothetical protein
LNNTIESIDLKNSLIYINKCIKTTILKRIKSASLLDAREMSKVKEHRALLQIACSLISKVR